MKVCEAGGLRANFLLVVRVLKAGVLSFRADHHSALYPRSWENSLTADTGDTCVKTLLDLGADPKKVQCSHKNALTVTLKSPPRVGEKRSVPLYIYRKSLG